MNLDDTDCFEIAKTAAPETKSAIDLGLICLIVWSCTWLCRSDSNSQKRKISSPDVIYHSFWLLKLIQHIMYNSLALEMCPYDLRDETVHVNASLASRHGFNIPDDRRLWPQDTNTLLQQTVFMRGVLVSEDGASGRLYRVVFRVFVQVCLSHTLLFCMRRIEWL